MDSQIRPTLTRVMFIAGAAVLLTRVIDVRFIREILTRVRRIEGGQGAQACRLGRLQDDVTEALGRLDDLGEDLQRGRRVTSVSADAALAAADELDMRRGWLRREPEAG